MSILKTYSVPQDFSSGCIANQLHTQIENSATVTDFSGVTIVDDEVSIEGASLNDETGLDAVIAAHVPNTTIIAISKTVQQNKEFADDMMQRLKEKNIAEGLDTIDKSAWVHHRLRKVDYTMDDTVTVIQLDVLNLVVSGDIETADKVLGQISPDDMTEDYHWLTQARIDWIRNEIRTYLGWPQI